MKAQILYDLREDFEFCSGQELHEFFREVCKGEPSPSGKTVLPFRSGETFVLDSLKAMAENSPSLIQHIDECWKAFQKKSIMAKNWSSPVWYQIFLKTGIYPPKEGTIT